MRKMTPGYRIGMICANILAILFLLLPLAPIFLGAFQTERGIQGDTKALWPVEYTLENFRLILTGGKTKGEIFNTMEYLPKTIENFPLAFLNSVIVAVAVTFFPIAIGALSAYTISRLKLRWTGWLLQLNLMARMIPLIIVTRPEYMTVPLVLAGLVSDFFVFFTLMMAICLVGLAPTLVLVLTLQKYLVKGLTAGAVKG